RRRCSRRCAATATACGIRAMANSRRRVPVRVALTAWYLLVLGAVIVGFSAVIYWAQERALHAQLDQAVHIAARQALALVDDEGAPRFERNETFGHVSRHLADAGYGVVLQAPSGRIVDRFGHDFAWPESTPAAPGLATLQQGRGDPPWRLDWRKVERDDGS